MSSLLVRQVDPKTGDWPEDKKSLSPLQQMMSMFPSPHPDLGQGSPYRAAVHNIYKTKDGRYYHTHGTNPHLIRPDFCKLFTQRIQAA